MDMFSIFVSPPTVFFLPGAVSCREGTLIVGYESPGFFFTWI